VWYCIPLFFIDTAANVNKEFESLKVQHLFNICKGMLKRSFHVINFLRERMRPARWSRNQKRKGPRTKAPFTSHHPLPPKRSFSDQKLIDDASEITFIPFGFAVETPVFHRSARVFYSDRLYKFIYEIELFDF
jgi:hypothetical protein